MLNSIGIHVKVKNFKKSYKFYSALGFVPIFEYGPKKAVKEDYSGAVFELKGTKIEIANGHRAVRGEVFLEQIMSSKISLMVNVDSLYDVIELCQVNNIRLYAGPRHYYWGTLEVAIKDPDGMVIVLICPFSEAEALKIEADETYSRRI